MQNEFWSDAAKCGAICGCVYVAGQLLGMIPHLSIMSIAAFVAYVYLLYRYTSQRAKRLATPTEGYGYGKCLRFILAISFFVGIMSAAYGILSSKVLFAAQYEESINQALLMLENTGIYKQEQIDMLTSFYMSPSKMALMSVVGQLLVGLFIGLFVAAGAKREPQTFDGNSNFQNE